MSFFSLSQTTQKPLTCSRLTCDFKGHFGFEFSSLPRPMLFSKILLRCHVLMKPRLLTYHRAERRADTTQWLSGVLGRSSAFSAYGV